jgi:hypothetical protein
MGTFVSGSQNINQASKFTSPYMIGARDSLAMVYHPNNTLLLFGGEDQSNALLNELWEFNINTSKWSFIW